MTLGTPNPLEESLHILYAINHGIIGPHSWYLRLSLAGFPEQESTATWQLSRCPHHPGRIIIQAGFKPGILSEIKLKAMSAKCGSLVDARRVFDEMPKQNVVSWTALIADHVRRGLCEEALTLFSKMQFTGVRPDQFTFAILIPACANLTSLEHGVEVHGDVIRRGFQSNMFVGSALVDMYSKCGRMEFAHKVFDQMPQRNEVSWTAMIAGYAENEHLDEALKLFHKMPRRDLVSWNAMIARYAENGHLDEALKLFQQTPKQDAASWNTLIAGYAQNGRVDQAFKFFQKMPEQNVVSWNTMIGGYAQNEQFDESLKLFQQMQLTGVKPNSVSFASVLPAYASSAALEQGKEVHEDMIRSGIQFDIFVENALVDMYSKHGGLQNARQVFDSMSQRNLVSWNAMIAGYVQSASVNEALVLFQKMPERNVISWTVMIAGWVHNGSSDDALKLFRQMQLTGVKPDAGIVACVLPACANLASLRQGKEVHGDIIRRGCQFDVFVGSALVDMYAKCGSIGNARQVFDKMCRRDEVSWTAMIVGYAIHGCSKEAIELFELMQHSSMKPNDVTFVGVLSACCHAGLVDDGWLYFESMSKNYCITPAVEHYCCMVDILGRAGQLDKAQDLINGMPIKPNAAVWGSLLAACRIHDNTELGEFVAERLFELDPTNAAHYVLLSNIYAASGRWDKRDKVQKLMKDRGLKKIPGRSWIDINNKSHAFSVGDTSHPQLHEIYAELKRLSGHMKEAGYVPDTNFVMHDVEEEQKEHIIFYHSEKLAIAFGLINTPPGVPIQIIKNLRVCGDCHSAIKVISKIAAREIVVRDANRFHHFKDGQCSCGDYW